MNPLRQLTVLFYLTAMTSCGTQNPLQPPRFDADNGDMIVTQREAVVFARDLPHISRAGRDYIYLGPVEVTRNGVQRYYLWVGTASTLDRAFRGESPPEMSRLSLEVGGEVLDLPLTEWTSEVGGPYRVAAPVHASQISALGFDDLERVLADDLASIRLYDTSGHLLDYSHWRGGWSVWEAEESEAAVGFKVEVR